MSIFFLYSMRSLWARRATTLVTATGIGLLVFLLSASMMLASGLERTLLRAGSDDKAIVLQVDGFSEGSSRLAQRTVHHAASAPGVRAARGNSPLLAGECVVHVYLPEQRNPAQHASVQVRGVTGTSFELRPAVRIVEGRAAKPGTNEAIVGHALLGDYEGIELGHGFHLQKERRLHIVGVFDADGSAFESEVWADLDFVRSAFNMQGYVSSVTAQLTSERAFEAFKLAVESDPRLGLSVEREVDYYEKVSNNLTRVITGIGGSVAFVFSFGALLGATITMHSAVSQRRRELGVLRALGFRGWHVLSSILLESLLVAAAGGICGLALALSLQFFHVSTVNWATGQELVFGFAPSASTALAGFVFGLGVGLLGGLYPAARAARVHPALAMRG